jgi:hypothetical protein
MGGAGRAKSASNMPGIKLAFVLVALADALGVKVTAFLPAKRAKGKGKK